jgi:hypothetical protein
MGIFSIFKESKEEKIERLKKKLESENKLIKKYRDDIDRARKNKMPKHYIEGTKRNIKIRQDVVKSYKEQIKELKNKKK